MIFLLCNRHHGIRLKCGNLPFDTRCNGFTVALHALMAFHILGVHTSDAVVGASASGVIMRVVLNMLDEVRVLDKHVRHLEEFESFVHDLLTVVTTLHTAYVDEYW